MSKSFSLATTLLSALVLSQGFAEESSFKPKDVEFTSPLPKKEIRKSPVVKASFSPFTGKVSANKVRMRLQPDLDGYIVRELNQNEIISVVAQEGDFYCIQPPEAIKAFIFRSFILDGVVEGNRVNVRLAPDLEAPIIGHHNSGDQVTGKISSYNKKWLEIAPPSNTHFYVSKEFIDFAGGPDLKAKIDKRKEVVARLLENATEYASAEMEKPFEEIDFEHIKQGFLTVIGDYADFPKQVKHAKESLVAVQENYLDKRIAYLENKASLTSAHPIYPNAEKAPILTSIPLQMWEPIEKALYLSWAEVNEQNDIDTFYDQQKVAGVAVSGVLEAFTSSVKNKPGDFIIKNKNLPVAYVYSTNVHLDEFVGKKVTLIGSPRPNNNFAFPAYYVHSVE